MLPLGAIEEAIREREITVQEIMAHFQVELEAGLSGKIRMIGHFLLDIIRRLGR